MRKHVNCDTVEEEHSLLAGPQKGFTTVVYVKVQSEFSVQSITTSNFFLMNNHCKLFTDQSERSAISVGW